MAYAVILLVYSVCPFLVQIAGFILNSIYPDPIPFLDEFIMIMCMGAKLERIEDTIDNINWFRQDHPFLFTIILIAVLLALGALIYFLYQYFKRGGTIFGFSF